MLICCRIEHKAVTINTYIYYLMYKYGIYFLVYTTEIKCYVGMNERLVFTIKD